MKVQKCSKISGSSIFITICLFYIKFSSAALSFGKSACDSPQSWRLQRHCLEMPYTKNGPQWKTDLVGGKEGICLLLQKPGMSCLLSVQFNSVAESCPSLCDPLNHRKPGRPVHHQLPEFIQTHVHQVSDAIQPSHPLPFPSPPALNLSQHQGLFQ